MNRIIGSSNDDNFLLSNSNIYNWEKLNNEFELNAKTQDEFLFSFFKKFDLEYLDRIQGSYSIAYSFNNKIVLVRDVIGIKPLCYFFNEERNEFFFASELKDLPKEAIEFNPRTYIVYDKLTNKVEIANRDKYYESKKINDDNDDYIMTKTTIKQLFIESVKRRVVGAKRIGVLFSGGTDSTFMALALQQLGIDFTCYTASIVGGNIREGRDIYYARRIAKECGFNWKLAEVDFGDVPDYTKKVMNIIASCEYTKVSVALPLFVALERAKQDGVDFMFTGIGSEEVFADYKRAIDVNDINEICVEGLKSLWIRDLYRDDTLASYNDIELKFPFLDDEFVDYSIRINSDFKIDKKNGVNKVIIRDILRDFGLSEEFVGRSKKAAQYGSKSDRVFEKLARAKRMKKQEYLNCL